MTITRAIITEAATRIAPFIRRTPVMDIAVPGIEKPVCLKLELFQHTGSFKPRGAFTNLVGAKIPKAGVAAASGGNHGAAVAYAAKVLGIKARIFVPTISSPAKVARIAGYGATIVQEGANYQEAVGLCQDYVRESGALNIHAYDMETTLAGQGTLARELEEQAPDLDTILVAVGGGGLIGGIASWYQSKSKIVGVEPETCNCLHAALAAGNTVTIKPSGLAADSLGASSAGLPHVSHCAKICRPCCPRDRRRHPERPALALDPCADCDGARRCRGLRRPAFGKLQAGKGRACWRHCLWRQHAACDLQRTFRHSLKYPVAM